MLDLVKSSPSQGPPSVTGTAAGAVTASKEAGCCEALRPFSDCSSQQFCCYGAGRQRDPANCDSLMEHFPFKQC